MAIPKGKHQISISVDDEVYEDLLRISKILEMPVSKVARNVLYCGMDDVKMFEKVGVLKAVKIYRNFNKYINEKSFWLGHAGKTVELPDE